MDHINQIGPYSLGPIKTFKGHESERCMQGSIIKAGKKIADWSEDSWGGPHQFFFKDRNEEKAFYAAANAHQIAIDFVREMEEKYSTKVEGNHVDVVVSTIAQDLAHVAELKRWCKTKTVIKEANGAEGEYVIYKGAYRLEWEAELMKRHPGAEIINKRFL